MTTPAVLYDMVDPASGKLYEITPDELDKARQYGLQPATKMDMWRWQKRKELDTPMGALRTFTQRATDELGLGVTGVVRRARETEEERVEREIAAEVNPIASGLGTAAGFAGDAVVTGVIGKAVGLATKAAGARLLESALPESLIQGARGVMRQKRNTAMAGIDMLGEAGRTDLQQKVARNTVLSLGDDTVQSYYTELSKALADYIPKQARLDAIETAATTGIATAIPAGVQFYVDPDKSPERFAELALSAVLPTTILAGASNVLSRQYTRKAAGDALRSGVADDINVVFTDVFKQAKFSPAQQQQIVESGRDTLLATMDPSLRKAIEPFQFNEQKLGKFIADKGPEALQIAALATLGVNIFDFGIGQAGLAGVVLRRANQNIRALPDAWAQKFGTYTASRINGALQFVNKVNRSEITQTGVQALVNYGFPQIGVRAQFGLASALLNDLAQGTPEPTEFENQLSQIAPLTYERLTIEQQKALGELRQMLPTNPPTDAFATPLPPTDAQQREFVRQFRVIVNPVDTILRNTLSGTLTASEWSTFSRLYPEMANRLATQFYTAAKANPAMPQFMKNSILIMLDERKKTTPRLQQNFQPEEPQTDVPNMPNSMTDIQRIQYQ